MLHSLFFINIDFKTPVKKTEIEVIIIQQGVVKETTPAETHAVPESPYIEQIIDEQVNEIPQEETIETETVEVVETIIPKETKELRVKHISSKTKEYVYRSYHEVWQKKVERMGTMYYPKASAVKASSDNLITQVTVNSDGSIADITILRSSGSKELDQAASDIVRRGSNYAEFSEQMKQEVDQVTITRVWKFI